MLLLRAVGFREVWEGRLAVFQVALELGNVVLVLSAAVADQLPLQQLFHPRAVSLLKEEEEDDEEEKGRDNF